MSVVCVCTILNKFKEYVWEGRVGIGNLGNPTKDGMKEMWKLNYISSFVKLRGGSVTKTEI